MKRETAAICKVVFVNVLWGLSFIASKTALNSGFTPFALALMRFLLASALLLPILRVRSGRLVFPRAEFGRMLASALMGMTIYFLCEYKGLERTSASTASLIIAAVPAFALLYGAIVRRRRVAPLCYVGVALSLVGVYMIVRFGAADTKDSLIGNLLILGAVLCWVGYLEITSVLLKTHSSLYVSAWQSVFAAVTLIPCALTERVDIAAITPVGWWMAMYLAIFCSGIGYILYADAIAELSPFRTAVFININPLAAVLGGVLLLGERITWAQVIGGVVVLVSILFVNLASVGKNNGATGEEGRETKKTAGA